MDRPIVGFVALGSASLVLALSRCGGSDTQATGRPGVDAGATLPDAGTQPPDAGLSDAGAIPPDAGAPVPDAGPDAGLPDAGVPDGGGSSLPPVEAAPDGGTHADILAVEHAPDSLVQDADTLYWVDRSPYCTGTACSVSVRSIPKVGGTATTLASVTGKAFVLGVDAASVYFAGVVGTQACGRPSCNPVWKLYRVDKGGGAPIELASGAGNPDQLGVGADDVYVSGALAGQSWSDYGVLAIPKDGSAPTVLAREHTRDVMLAGSTLIWSLTDGIRELPSSGGSPTWVSSQASLNPTRMAADDINVYFLAQSSLWTAPLAGGAPRVLIQGGTGAAVSSVDARGGQVFWTLGGCIGEVRSDGSAPRCLDDDRTTTRSVQADDADLFGIRGTQIVRLPR